MEHFELIRRRVFVEGLSIREVARRLNHSRSSVRKALRHSVPLGYQPATDRKRPKLDPFMSLIRQWLTDDLQQPRKQRHTAVRIWERLRDEHQYAGARRGVSDAVKQIRSELVPPEIFVPIDHPCGEEFQIDWGEVTVKLNNEVKKVMIFCARSAYSKATFVRAYLTPVPCVTDISELNEHLSGEATKDLTRSCKESKKSYGELHAHPMHRQRVRLTFVTAPI